MPPKKKPKVEKGQTFLSYFKTCDKDSDERASGTISKDSGSIFLPNQCLRVPHRQATEVDAPVTAAKQKVDLDRPSDDSAKSKDTESTRTIVDSWFKLFLWLIFDKEQKVMRCSVCTDDKVAENSFTRGCNNFRKSALTEHAATTDHKNALKTPVNRSNQEEVAHIMLTKEENGIAQAIKAVHWLVSEDLPLSKFESFMGLMAEYEVTDVDRLKMSESASYTSRYTANDILEVLAEDVDIQAGKQLEESLFLSVLADETTDINVKKRMGIFVRILDKNFVPYTRFLTNINIDSGTGEAIATAILDEMSKWNVTPDRIVALGSDGAAAMTGTNYGATGMLLRKNPHLVNVHCIAHRLALCTSQGAKEVPALQDFQETLTTLFYYFKKSAIRSETLSKIQETLDSPTLAMKEVHSVRWLSFYTALDSVFHSLDPLLTYLADTDRRRDPKAGSERLGSRGTALAFGALWKGEDVHLERWGWGTSAQDIISIR